MWKFKFLCSENVSLTISSLFGRGGMHLICSVLLASIMVAPGAHAQDSNDDENELEEIVVTATRIPTPLADTLPTTAIITAEDIERIKPQGFGELLKLTSGIGFRDSGGRGSSGGLFVRGTSSSQTLILIDGIRTSSATTGATAIQRIPLESIERIEIIKGPMSGVYGADAIGGVIQIFTKAYQDEGAFGDVSTTAGSNQLRKHYARAGYGDEVFSVSASLSKESTDGIDRTAFKGGGNEDRDGFEQSSGNFSLSLYPQDDLVLKIGHVQSSATIEYDNTSRFGDFKRNEFGEGWHQRTKLNTTSVQFNYDHAENVKLSGSFGVTEDFLINNAPPSPSNYIRTKKTDYSVQADLILSTRNQVAFGVDYQKDKVDATAEYDKTKRTNKGLFALWQHQRSHSSTVLNARYDRNSLYGSTSNYSLQQSFDVTEQYRIIASYGTAFKAPTFNNLYWPKRLGSRYEGNPDVKPEESKSFEISLRASLDELNWQINAFQTKVTNLINWKPIDPTDDMSPIRPTNVDKSELKGVEVELSREWDDYIFRTSLDYLEAEDEEGKFLNDRARSSASFEFGKQIDNLYVGIDAFAEHGRHEDGNKLPGYALWGLYANYEISESLSISGKVDNLFDKEYVTNVASGGNNYQNEGRTFQVSVEYKF